MTRRRVVWVLFAASCAGIVAAAVWLFLTTPPSDAQKTLNVISWSLAVVSGIALVAGYGRGK